MLAGDILKANARLFPDRVGLIDEQRMKLSWRELNSRVNSLANTLISLGVRKGDRVAIICDSCHEFVEVLFASFKVGAIPAGISYRLTAEQIEALLNHCGAIALFVQSKYAPTINSISSRLEKVRYFVGIGNRHNYPYDHETMIAQNVADEPKADISETDICNLVYTSGTTGLPKGVVHSHRELIKGCLAELFVYRFGLDDKVLVDPPLYTAAGGALSISAFFAGTTVVTHTFSGRSFLELIEREGVTVVTSMIPTRFHIIQEFLKTATRKYDLSSVCSLGTGSQILTPNQLKEIVQFFGSISRVNKPYVGTEIFIATALMPHEVAAGLRDDATEKEIKRLQSVGKPVLDFEVKVVGQNDQELPPGQTGEIITRTGTIVDMHYWARPDLTEQRLRNGWYYTSDLGVIDDDGYLYYAGRKDDMIRSGAFFIAPAQVESVIAAHPAVHECAVFGSPDEKWGEAVTAAVSLKKDQKVSEEELKKYCREFLSGFQTPKSIYIMEELPKDPGTKKILVRELKKLPGQNLSTSDLPPKN